jgi:hypothetical protein
MTEHDIQRIRDGRTLSDDSGRAGNPLMWAFLAVFVCGAVLLLAALVLA